VTSFLCVQEISPSSISLQIKLETDHYTLYREMNGSWMSFASSLSLCSTHNFGCTPTNSLLSAPPFFIRFCVEVHLQGRSTIRTHKDLVRSIGFGIPMEWKGNHKPNTNVFLPLEFSPLGHLMNMLRWNKSSFHSGGGPFNQTE
jgi:hypothetical protein